MVEKTTDEVVVEEKKTTPKKTNKINNDVREVKGAVLDFWLNGKMLTNSEQPPTRLSQYRAKQFRTSVAEAKRGEINGK